MSGVAIRRAAAADFDTIAGMVRRLARDTGADKIPKITGPALARDATGEDPLLRLWVAEEAGEAVGMLVGVLTFSTWRGTRGLYVCDLYVDGRLRGRKVGEALLASAARESAAEGLGFLKLEVAPENDGARRFYERLGFATTAGETLWTLECDGMGRLASLA